MFAFGLESEREELLELPELLTLPELLELPELRVLAELLELPEPFPLPDMLPRTSATTPFARLPRSRAVELTESSTTCP